MSEFRRHAHLGARSHVNIETVSRALAGVLKVYQREQRLEAEIKLESQDYDPKTKTVNYRFSASRGPIVKLRVEGAGISQDRLKRLVPIFEEGSVDEDLLNEGNRRLRNYYQRLGYFDVKVEHERQTATAEQVTIIFKVRLGQRRHVERVSVAGQPLLRLQHAQATAQRTCRRHSRSPRRILSGTGLGRHQRLAGSLPEQWLLQRQGNRRDQHGPDGRGLGSHAIAPEIEDNSAYGGLPHRRGSTTASRHWCAWKETSMWKRPS